MDTWPQEQGQKDRAARGPQGTETAPAQGRGLGKGRDMAMVQGWGTALVKEEAKSAA